MSRQIQFTACVLIGGAIALTSALARDPQPAPRKDAREPATTGKAGARLDKATLPAALENLQLSDDQQKQVRQLMDKYNGEIDSVWKEFTRQYLDTIALEAKLLAAVEDSLDDSQRTHIRKQRARTAHGSATNDRKEDADKRQGRREVRSDQRDPEPGAAVEEVLIVGVSLTPEQERAADAVYASYSDRLRNGKREIHQLHNRILSLESEKLADIEQLLTKEQSTQLRQDRQAAAGAERSASESKPSKVK
jgi:hypothetical protein